MADFHVLGANTQGELRHTFTNSITNSWQPYFGDVESQIGQLGYIIDTDCATANGVTHVCCVVGYDKNSIYYTSRDAAGAWSKPLIVPFPVQQQNKQPNGMGAS